MCELRKVGVLFQQYNKISYMSGSNVKLIWYFDRFIIVQNYFSGLTATELFRHMNLYRF